VVLRGGVDVRRHERPRDGIKELVGVHAAGDEPADHKPGHRIGQHGVFKPQVQRLGGNAGGRIQPVKQPGIRAAQVVDRVVLLHVDRAAVRFGKRALKAARGRAEYHGRAAEAVSAGGKVQGVARLDHDSKAVGRPFRDEARKLFAGRERDGFGDGRTADPKRQRHQKRQSAFHSPSLLLVANFLTIMAVALFLCGGEDSEW